MKSKPFAFQIWVTITAFLVFIICIFTLVLVQYLSVDLLKDLARIFAVLSIVNICIAKIISIKITEPLRYLEYRVRKIANKQWGEPIHLDRGDEFGQLASSVNMMRGSLKKMETEEELFLQNVSHDLKTPIMVIKSYAQALSDRIYLNDSFEETVAVIIKESFNLEKKVEKLLYLKGLDYILERKNEFEFINIKTILMNLIDRFSLSRKDVIIDARLIDILIYGDQEELTVAFENILENNLRYAHSSIVITVNNQKYEENGYVEITFANDGPPIENEVLDQLFKHFHKGTDGKFGLGLFITKKIIKFHGGKIEAKNSDSEVLFNIILPNDYKK
ncbi:sensor histidine kinase [Peribacillus sp. NPDC060186]|uniref:sensor histidine kinase n=1 Tax=Peribacillus butanolivorans TaxID=421767 RepID=UPI00207CAAEF|nr:HAMP domain-containing sensor histidine kinase [Peribacillus butanolivorans]MCO0600520.1 HAMP domain-containing histidine kinase [Peribacillus butanolivorans]